MDKVSVTESQAEITGRATETMDVAKNISTTSATATLKSEPATEAKSDIMTKALIADKADNVLLPKVPAKQPSFIPPAAAKMPEEESVPTTGGATATRPSLINKISGLWSQKPENAATAKAPPNPATDKTGAQAERNGSILDLPRGDMVQHGNDDSAPESSEPISTGGTQGTFDNAGDDLDIPAFLRRQAN